MFLVYNILEGNPLITTMKSELRTAITAHIEALNAKNGEFMEISSDAVIEDLIDFNPDIKSFDDYLRFELFEEYYDSYKDVNGISPRWLSWSDNSVAGWESELAAL